MIRLFRCGGRQLMHPVGCELWDEYDPDIGCICTFCGSCSPDELVAHLRSAVLEGTVNVMPINANAWAILKLDFQPVARFFSWHLPPMGSGLGQLLMTWWPDAMRASGKRIGKQHYTASPYVRPVLPNSGDSP